MSSSCGSVCLLVLLGVVMAFGNPLNYLPETLRQSHESIADVLRLKEPEIGENRLFRFVVDSINTSCQRKEDIQLMNATLGVYMRIFSSILQHSHHQHHDETSALLDQVPSSNRSQVKSNVKELQKMMEKLRLRLSQVNLNRKDMMSELNKIKVDDPVDQRKALAEFERVYMAASLITS
ncbi:interferon gamma 1-like [Lates japonicus]|uniref:Interferon gamma 1-like protein n=1 Tax=Lates japonicus TaxID=270547 RepID=A0AAD3QVY4_LATJO|nr:interferon gamma 1-like protein [Lates japonicus]